MKPVSAAFIIGFIIVAALPRALADPPAGAGGKNHDFQLSSTTFADGATLPLSAVWDQCTAYPGGGNVSPELSWINAPKKTQSFVVVMYDVTASFTHWGMYNISAQAAGLPSGAGTAGSAHGTQVLNDYFVGMEYDGPCPPPTLSPPTHRYVFTVYALDTSLAPIPAFGDFAPGPEALHQALIEAGLSGHILNSASITGFFGR
jgi:Raf kinase inhibitor-like YbhB/YbcL family protein